MSSSTTDSGFIHHFIPAETGDVASAPTLLLLHGTGGNESDLLELGRSLAPGYNLLSPRGKILENGMPRFFRRLAEGVFDEEDLKFRTQELADFVLAAVKQYQIDGSRITALGYSNGANIAASLFLLKPEVLSRGVLLRAMVPLQPEAKPKLRGKEIFLAAGRFDPLIPLANSKQLAEMLTEYGAEVELHEISTGHQLTSAELEAAKHWINA